MVAGHIMLKLITSAFVKILSTKFLVPLIVILILFTLIYSLELFIAFLQAFVFILLLNLYLKDFVIIHHQT
jgi:F0F1-type ATP synthase membrane subunit a